MYTSVAESHLFRHPIIDLRSVEKQVCTKLQTRKVSMRVAISKGDEDFLSFKDYRYTDMLIQQKYY